MIFISYRHADSEGWARALHDSLCEAFGRRAVRLDVEGAVDHGTVSRRVEEEIRRCLVVLVLIGPTWNTRFGSSEGTDYVLRELEHALAFRKSIVPVLLPGAPPDYSFFAQEGGPDPFANTLTGRTYPDDLRKLVYRLCKESRACLLRRCLVRLQRFTAITAAAAAVFLVVAFAMSIFLAKAPSFDRLDESNRGPAVPVRLTHCFRWRDTLASRSDAHGAPGRWQQIPAVPHREVMTEAVTRAGLRWILPCVDADRDWITGLLGDGTLDDPIDLWGEDARRICQMIGGDLPSEEEVASLTFGPRSGPTGIFWSNQVVLNPASPNPGVPAFTRGHFTVDREGSAHLDYVQIDATGGPPPRRNARCVRSRR